jgi:hypothetical protein
MPRSARYYYFTPVDQLEDQLADVSLDSTSRTQRMRHPDIGRRRPKIEAH